MASEDYPSKSMDVTIAMWQEQYNRAEDEKARADQNAAKLHEHCLRADNAEMKAREAVQKYHKERNRRIELERKTLELATRIIDIVKRED